MKLTIITGASAGLGKYIAHKTAERGYGLIVLNRSEDETVKDIAEKNDVFYHFESVDLANLNGIENALQLVAKQIDSLQVEELYLVNNAAMIEPIQFSYHNDLAELTKHIQLNLTAPVTLTNKLIEIANEKQVALKIGNVSSGAALRAIPGWSAYCMTKAAINMFTETVALELKEAGLVHKVFTFNPGVMDTNMQSTIRSSDEAAFPEVEQFRSYKTNSHLQDPEQVAAVFVKILYDENIQSGKFYNMNDYR